MVRFRDKLTEIERFPFCRFNTQPYGELPGALVFTGGYCGWAEWETMIFVEGYPSKRIVSIYDVQVQKAL